VNVETIRLVGPRVLVKRDAPEAEVGSLAIPQSAQTEKHKVLQGTVVKAGTRRNKRTGNPEPLPCAPGDRVVYHFLSGEDFTQPDGEYVILQESEIQAVMGA
jgi:co-chaperonin GroES (HSP10)